MKNSTRDFLAIEFPGATPAEAAILAQECATTLHEAGVDPGSIQIARTNEEAMDLGGLLLVLAPLGYAFLEAAAKSAGGEAGKDIYKKINDALGSLSRRHRTAIQIKGADGTPETVGHEFQTVAPSGKAGAGLGKLGIVLLGASEFPYMNDATLNNAAFGRSAALAKTLFSPPHTAFTRTEVLDLFNKEMAAAQVHDAIEQHIGAHPDMHDLLVYYCGHGSFQSDKTYYLLLRSTRKGRESTTGFEPRKFRGELEPLLINKRVYFVVDCCFSGAIVESLQSESLERVVEDQLTLDMPQRGWTVLTASAKDKVAMAPKGESYTMFTGALAHVIEGGSGAAGVRFNFRDLADEAGTYVTTRWQRLAVMPQCISPRQTEGDIARLPIFLNKHKAKAVPEADGGRSPGDGGAPRPRPEQAAPGPAEREWQVFGLDTCNDSGLLLAFTAKWEKQDPVWAYRASKAAEALETGPTQREANAAPSLEWWAAEWARIKDTPYIGQLQHFAEHAHPYYAGEARAQIRVLQRAEAEAQCQREEEAERRKAEAARLASGPAPVAPVVRDTRPAWASDAGQDRFGLWAEFALGDVRQRMRWIEPGTFLMGSPSGEDGRFDDEGPQHEVRLTKGFWLGDTPVTQALWTAAKGNNPSRFEGPKRPVEQVSWEDVQEFLKKMNARVPGLDLKLPTEAQWEYACRAGTEGPNYARGGQTLADIAWFYKNSGEETHPVAAKGCNNWGLYDMLGNVWEWCADGKRSYTAKPVTDPAGPLKGASRALRGGSWFNDAGFTRAAFRNENFRGFGHFNFGFRCCA